MKRADGWPYAILAIPALPPRGDIMKAILAIALWVTAAAEPAIAAGVTPRAQCSFHAWSSDVDPRGLNLRAAPDRGAAIVGVLPPPKGDMAVEMHIVGSTNGWFEIDEAGFEDYPGVVSAKRVFHGTGWVFGGLIAFQVNDAKLMDSAQPNARRIAELRTDSSGPDSFLVKRVLDCSGDRAEVEGVFAGRHLHGWVDRICSNQVTTCP